MRSAEITVETAEGPLTLRREAAPVPDAEGVRTKVLDCLRHAGLGAEAEAAWERMLARLQDGPAADFLKSVPRIGAMPAPQRARMGTGA
ncbi:MAG TPA: hypothetical protein VE684_01710 [Crenalkalicoccus sp.]|jgi:hypothetical protein|nr:hypothetical protein [Crenalkalicoccus sp.]